MRENMVGLVCAAVAAGLVVAFHKRQTRTSVLKAGHTIVGRSRTSAPCTKQPRPTNVGMLARTGAGGRSPAPLPSHCVDRRRGAVLRGHGQRGGRARGTDSGLVGGLFLLRMMRRRTPSRVS